MSIESRKVTIYCPTCGNDQFSCVDADIDNRSDAPNDVKLKCADCNSIFTKGELIESGLDSHGLNLASKALSFDIDKNTGEIKKAPLIAINDLKTESDRNEQDGIRFMLMGFFLGPRNLYQHNHIGSGASNSILVIIEASFFLRLLDGHGITKNGHWISVKADYQEIYNRMPKLIDRWKLVRMLRQRAHLNKSAKSQRRN